MTETEEQQLVEITAFMQKMLGGDESGHDRTHIERVVVLTKHILTTEPTADEFIAVAAATLHDTYDDKVFKNFTSAKQAVVDMLTDNDVETIIYNKGNNYNLKNLIIKGNFINVY